MPSEFDRNDWGARLPNGGPGPLDPADVVGLAFHWPGMSAPIRGVNAVKSALRGWQRFHMDTRGWSDIAYQVAVDQDGNRYELRGLRTQSGANGDEDVNEKYGAVLLILAPDEKPTPLMVEGVRRVVAEHRALFPKSKLLVGHQEIRAVARLALARMLCARSGRGSSGRFPRNRPLSLPEYLAYAN